MCINGGCCVVYTSSFLRFYPRVRHSVDDTLACTKHNLDQIERVEYSWVLYTVCTTEQRAVYDLHLWGVFFKKKRKKKCRDVEGHLVLPNVYPGSHRRRFDDCVG